MTIYIVSLIAFIIVCVLLFKKFLPNFENKDIRHLFLYVLCFSIVAKILIAYFAPFFEVDITLYKAWGSLCNDVGFDTVYYQEQIYLDYPPAYLYILSFLDNIRRLFSLEYYGAFYTFLIKSPSIIADIVSGVLVYTLSKKSFSKNKSAVLSLLYMLNPLVIFDSGVWGQMDSICALSILISILFVQKNRFFIAGAVYGISILLKPQMLMFIPVFVFFLLFNKKFKELFFSIISAVIAIFALSLPFSQNFDFTFLFDCYFSTLDYYGYFTINAYNIFALFGLNWSPLPTGEVVSVLLDLSGALIASAVTGIYIFKNRKKPCLFTASSLILITLFIFSVKMHERYMFAVILLLLLTYVRTKDIRHMYFFLGFTITNYINVSYVFFLNNTYVSPTSPVIVLTSLSNLILFIFYVYFVFFGYKKEAFKITFKESTNKSILWLPTHSDRKMHVKDYIFIAFICLVYGAFAFYSLGSNTTANTSWTPSAGETAVFKIDGNYTKFSYLAGISEENERPRVGSNFNLEVSLDGQTYSLLRDLNNSSVYAWHEFDLSGYSYLRVTALDSLSVLNEIAFIDEGTETKAHISLVSGNAAALIDEQDSVPIHSSYYNSTYFDEIYHARTAYEHILGAEPYENTHPPLGKLIISFFINIFGMNPFGWRFAGALFGVLMLPVFYHIIRRLFSCSLIAAVGTFLFAFDFMHFTQTRIATIDTYSVFFILLMYDAMLVFIQKDIMKSSKFSLFLPLALSGIFMGLGIASKWTCAYGAIGLAVLFFAKLIISYRNHEDKKFAMLRIIDLCLFCMAFFVIIPFGIYFLSFMPILLLGHNSHDLLGNFLNYQNHMFSYHSGLVAEHGFASPWYEWPLVLRNIWYAVTYDYNGSGLVSTISCLGNPLLWTSSLLAVFYSVFEFIRKKAQSTAFILVGFLSVYLPWVLVPRLTFIYHYFTAVPFIILALMFLFSRLIQFKTPCLTVGKISISAVKIGILAFVLINFIMFLIYYPVLSGAPADSEYIKALQLYPDWTFISLSN